MNRRFLVVCACVALLAAAGGLAWRRFGPAAGRLNVLLITLDTTRADRLGCYGYAAGLTPALDRLAAAGAVFDSARCNVPITLPSHATMMTGLLPPEHDLRVNSRKALPDGVTTLAGIMSTRGYRTAAFVASPVLAAKFGLSRGFRTYDDAMPLGEITDADPEVKRRRGDNVADAATAWLRRNGARPFFCWVHFYDPHYPYSPHKDIFGERFANTPYDAEVAFMDMQVGRVLGCLSDIGESGRTLVIAVGDHGESLGGLHAEPRPCHGYMLYEQTLRVPMIFSMPGRVPSGLRISDPVSLQDLFSTVLVALGIHDQTQGCGRDLTPLFHGGTIPFSPCYAETEFPANLGWSPQQVLVDGRWKYVRTPRTELYDLLADPLELTNRADSMLSTLDEMEVRLTGIEKTMVPRSGRPVGLTRDERRQIESLGYVGGGASPAAPAAGRSLQDVKEMVPIMAMANEAEDLARQGDHGKSLSLWTEVVRRAPWVCTFRNSLGCGLMEDDRPREAVEEFARVKRELDETGAAGSAPAGVERKLYPLAVNNLAYALGKSGRYDEALPMAFAALKMDPENGQFRHTLATIYVGLHRHEEAMKYAAMALDAEPANPEFMLLLAGLKIEDGDLAGAAVLGERAINAARDEKLRQQARQILERTHAR